MIKKNLYFFLISFTLRYIKCCLPFQFINDVHINDVLLGKKQGFHYYLVLKPPQFCTYCRIIIYEAESNSFRDSTVLHKDCSFSIICHCGNVIPVVMSIPAPQVLLYVSLIFVAFSFQLSSFKNFIAVKVLYISPEHTSQISPANIT